MDLIRWRERIRGRYMRMAGSLFFRRMRQSRNIAPHISFTFDDFPRSALHKGGSILSDFNLRATYYASFSLMGKENETGPIFTAADLQDLFAAGHELGCHTFDHCHSWE
ncbi:MAG TPA: polysaccharide deacetylase family protein, partial [Thermodesulfobacteriota bacterium]|nr:polysaccharide deacetylase family protein [Thermodesulfobacteriota bacterium]